MNAEDVKGANINAVGDRRMLGELNERAISIIEAEN